MVELAGLIQASRQRQDYAAHQRQPRPSCDDFLAQHPVRGPQLHRPLAGPQAHAPRLLEDVAGQ